MYNMRSTPINVRTVNMRPAVPPICCTGAHVALIIDSTALLRSSPQCLLVQQLPSVHPTPASAACFLPLIASEAKLSHVRQWFY